MACDILMLYEQSVFKIGGDIMPNTNLEITQKAMEDFKKIQEYMLLAKEENSVKTYAKLKKEYLYLKSFLNIAGVNLIDIDEIKE